MAKSDVFRVNYFVGTVLAQGGNIWIEDARIIFSPTSALDRAMGAKNVEIPFDHIRNLTFKGDLMRTFNVQTAEKIHKFEGSHAKKVWEVLDKALRSSGVPLSEGPAAPALTTISASLTADPTTAAHAPAVVSPSSSVASESACASSVTSALMCDSCGHQLETGYSFCPTCGARIKSICSSCRKAVLASWSVCAFCGWKFSPGATAIPRK